MKLITFSLFGNVELYCQGAVENARLAKQIYPDWKARFYVDSSVPEVYLEKIQSYNSEIIYCNSRGQYDGLNWRFSPFSEENVGVWISRDRDWETT